MRAVRATLRNAFAEAAANPRALVAHMTVMAVNDLVWVAFWVIFFRRVGELRGWRRDDVLLLFSVITASAGITLGVFSNARAIGPLAAAGALDSVLALPRSPLLLLLVRRVEMVNLGDLAFGLGLFWFTGPVTVARVLTYGVTVLMSAVLLTSFLVLVGSSAFLAGRNEGGELGMHAVVMLSTYPADVVAGTMKVALYTVIPSAFVSSVPVRLIRHFEWGWALAYVGVTAAFAGVAALAFHRGLRRYSSGNVWMQA